MLCPCHSGIKYEKCCRPYHLDKGTENALKLMRSRYSAYALGLVDYVISTTHPDTAPADHKAWRHSIEIFCQTTLFEGLDILEFVDGEKTATVTFLAKLSSNGRNSSFCEKSLFFQLNNRWYYYSGHISQ